ncbi:MAG: oligosaccharide flippase family protein [Bacteroidales bacterium]
MKRKFITNLAFLLLLNILIKPFWVFGIDRTVQNTVGPEVYGWYYALFNLALIFNILLDIGITTFNNREISQDHSNLSTYFSLLSGVKFLLAFVYAFLVLVAGLFLGYDMLDFRLLFLLIINQFLASFLLYLRSNISGLQLFMTDSVVSVLDRLLVILFCGLLLWAPSFKNSFRIEWFVLSQTLAYGITILAAFLIVLGKAGKFVLRVNWKFSRSVLSKSFPYALLFLLMALYNWMGPVMLKRLLGAEGDLQTGIYAQAFRLLDFLSMFGVLMAGILLPLFSRMLHQDEKVEQLVKFSFLVIFIPSFILAVSFISYHREIMQLLYHAHADESAPVFLLLMIGFPAVSASYIFGTLLTANGNIRSLNKLAGSMVILTLLLNLLLIPAWGARGAAIACIASLIATALVQVFLSVKVFRFPVNRDLLTRLSLFAAVFLIATFLCHQADIHWTAGIGMLVIGGIGLAFILRLFNLRELYRLFFSGEGEAQL